MMSNDEPDVVFVDADTLRRIKNARQCYNNATNEWAKTYWKDVIKQLIEMCSSPEPIVYH